MRSDVDLLDAPEGSLLVTLERVKLELGISDSDTSKDAILNAQIEAASELIATTIRYDIGYKRVRETFHNYEEMDWSGLRALTLKTKPVWEIKNITFNGTTVLDLSRIHLNQKNGILHLYDSNGYPYRWWMHKNIVVEYTTGWVDPNYGLPGETSSGSSSGSSGGDSSNSSGAIDEIIAAFVPADLQLAATLMVVNYRFLQARDLNLKSEENVGVFRFQYTDPGASLGDQGFPPQVQMIIDGYRDKY